MYDPELQSWEAPFSQSFDQQEGGRGRRIARSYKPLVSSFVAVASCHIGFKAAAAIFANFAPLRIIHMCALRGVSTFY